MTSRLHILLPALMGVVLLAGCEQEYAATTEYAFTPHPRKVPKVIDGVGQDVKEPLDLDADERQEINEALFDFFGTPRDPIVRLPEAMLKLDELQLQPETLKKGSSLYRRLCLTCHGLSGDASGPTGWSLDPKPRDFRQGLFKFRSTLGKAPCRDDLKRTIHEGIPTANMPSFALLDETDIDALVSYVIHLSFRGQVELQFALEIRNNSTPDVQALLTSAASDWLKDAAETRWKPAALPKGGWAAIRQDGGKRGREIYEKTGACVQCHGNDGRASVEETPTNANRMNDWGDINRPRDLTLGAYRGGSRPLDLFWRIRLGIKGSGMPEANMQSLTEEDLWYLVDYVMSLPQKH